MTGQEAIKKTYRELEPLSQTSQELILRARRELESLSKASPEAFAAERDRRFRRLLEHHVHNTRNTAYAELWRVHGLDPRRDVPAALAEVERLPLVDRQFLKEADYAGRPAVPDMWVANRVATSGTTTGVPLTFPISFAARQRIYPELLLRCFLLIGAGDVLPDHSYHIAHYEHGTRSASGEIEAGTAMTGTSILFSETHRLLGSRVMVGDTRAPLEEHLQVFNEHRPRYSCSSPHVYLNLLATAQERGIDLSQCSLDYFLGGGAPMLGEDYTRLKKGLGLRRAALTYVSNETGLMGAQQMDGGPYTLFDDDYLVEVLDADGRHVAPGERGRIAVTSFAADAFPLIRYLIGDAATYLGRDPAFPNATAIAEIGRTAGAIIGGAKISFEEIGRMPHEMMLRGVPVLALQLARRKTVTRRDQLVMRVESPLEDVGDITGAALAVLRLNRQVESLLSGDELPPPIIEVYRPGTLRAGQFKLRPFVEESHLSAIEESAVPPDRRRGS
jgi:phenylacetate-coenzyme A ligase PaaK-like adenylate-forming protein